MAFVHGVGQVFKCTDSGAVLRDISAYVTSVDHPRSAATHDTTTLGVTGNARTFIKGLNTTTISIAGEWDSTATSGPDVVLNGLVNDTTARTYEYGPEGGAAGKVRYTGTAFLTEYATSGPVEGVVTFTASFQVSGAVTRNTF